MKKLSLLFHFLFIVYLSLFTEVYIYTIVPITKVRYSDARKPWKGLFESLFEDICGFVLRSYEVFKIQLHPPVHTVQLVLVEAIGTWTEVILVDVALSWLSVMPVNGDAVCYALEAAAELLFESYSLSL